MKILKKFISAAAAIAVSASSIPLFQVGAAGYDVRDPFYNFNSSYHYYESEHFQFIWGSSGDSEKVTSSFLEGNARNLEDCWDVYMNDLDMAAPSQSTNLSMRDGKEYKTNIYISGTGLAGMQDDWAYMSYDKDGYAYMFCCVDSMQYEPPSWVLPHEFGHVVTAHQLGWNDNKYSYAWWESLGNWFREQYLYSDHSSDDTGHGTDFFETYMKNLCFSFPFGRDYYAAWPFLQYLTENPDNLEGYGKNFVRDMLQQGRKDEYPFDVIDRLAPADIKDTLGNFAKHMAGLDFENGTAYRARLNELLSQGSWNWQQIYTMLEPVSGEENTYTVPTERAPQFAGMNIIPLNISGNEIEASLNGLTNINGADWRACIVQQTSDGNCTYSALFKSGEKMSVPVISGADAYLTVIAVPDLDSITKAGLPYGEGSEFAEEKVSFSSKERYPYSVRFGNGVSMKQREVTTVNNWWETYSPHPNGGGLVSSNAKVDASVYVAPNAKVLGTASVTGNARIEDHAVVQDSASVSGNAVIAGNAIIAESAVISENARVDDNALVMGRAKISGNARVTESACVYGDFTIKDNGCAKGNAFCMASGTISGQGTADGDYYDDGNKIVTNGTVYGWVSSQSYASSRPYTDKQMYSYDFSDTNGYIFGDKYNSTYGIVSNGYFEKERTGAENVLTFGKDGGYAELDRGMLYSDKLDLQTAILPRSAEGKQTVLYLGNENAFLEINAFGNNGAPQAILSDGKDTAFLNASDPIELGAWCIIRLVIENGSAVLYINGEEAASAVTSITPCSIASAVETSDPTAAYRLGADNKLQNSFNGSIDFIREYYSLAAAPNEIYSEKEDIEDVKEEVLIGDLDKNEKINVFDLVLLKRKVVG